MCVSITSKIDESNRETGDKCHDASLYDGFSWGFEPQSLASSYSHIHPQLVGVVYKQFGKSK